MATGNIKIGFDKSMVEDTFKPCREFLERIVRELAKRKPDGKVIKWSK